jgi:hypothetical protein
MLSAEDTLVFITDSKKFLEPYKVYGTMITDGIAQLDKLEALVRSKSYAEAYMMVCAMCDQISTYRGFVPALAENLEKTREILKGLC